MENRLKDRSLLEECVDALQATVLPRNEEIMVEAMFEKMCPLTTWGKVNWDRFDKQISVGFCPEYIVPALEILLGKDFNKEVYITWDTYNPIIKTNLNDIIKEIDCVIRVSMEKFIFNPTVGYVVEIRHMGRTTVGVFPTSDKFFQNETYVDPHVLQHNILFRYGIEALKVNLLPKNEEKSLDTWFKKHVPITKWGRVDWDVFEKKTDIGYDYKNIKRVLSKFLGAKGPIDKTVYIEWGEAGMPVIKTSLDDVIQHFGALEPVSFEKFLFNPSLGYVIEILNSRQMTVGIVPGFNQKNDV